MSGYHDIEGPFVSACATQDARDEFFDDHISHVSMSAKAMLELCHRLGFDTAADALVDQLSQSLTDDGIPDDEHEAAEENINRSMGMGPDKWLDQVARTIAIDERNKLREVVKGSVVPFIRAVMA